jgi:uncharacterized membrane protein YeaQ/YmgE (transglycosylase-associated protein family)
MHLWAALLFGVALVCMATTSVQTNAAASEADQVSASVDKAGQAVQDAGQTAKKEMDNFWRQVDEKRLKNRTPDEVAAWAVMGILVGVVILRFSKLNWFVTILLGLAGAFVGGILENLIKLDFGMGPVLIRYEELLASVVGGVLIILAGRMLAARRAPNK